MKAETPKTLKEKYWVSPRSLNLPSFELSKKIVYGDPKTEDQDSFSFHKRKDERAGRKLKNWHERHKTRPKTSGSVNWKDAVRVGLE